MDRFLESSDPLKKARSKAIQGQLNGCRERIRQLTETKASASPHQKDTLRLTVPQHAPFDLALQSTQEFLAKQTALDLPEVDDEVVQQLNAESELIKSELERERTIAANLKQQLEEVWKHDRSAVYELTSVFIHRGTSPSWGHYFFYSRNLPEKPDEWFKYNDSDVSVVSKEEVLKDTTGDTANPYLVSWFSPCIGLGADFGSASWCLRGRMRM